VVHGGVARQCTTARALWITVSVALKKLPLLIFFPARAEDDPLACVTLDHDAPSSSRVVHMAQTPFPAIFFAAIIGVIVFIAVSQVLLDSYE
jgi:hypothetical protein